MKHRTCLFFINRSYVFVHSGHSEPVQSQRGSYFEALYQIPRRQLLFTNNLMSLNRETNLTLVKTQQVHSEINIIDSYLLFTRRTIFHLVAFAVKNSSYWFTANNVCCCLRNREKLPHQSQPFVLFFTNAVLETLVPKNKMKLISQHHGEQVTKFSINLIKQYKLLIIHQSLSR